MFIRKSKFVKYLGLFSCILIYYFRMMQKSNDEGHFWVFTDSHLDIFYQSQSDATTRCHNLTLNNITKIIRKFGQFNCDIPSELLSSAFSASKKIDSNIDFIIWLGDATSHNGIKSDTNIPVHINLTGEFKRFFPDKLIIPVLGNHDIVFKSNRSTCFKEFYQKTNYNLLIKEPHAQKTFMKGGYYYKRYQPPGQNTFLRFVVLNTVMFQPHYAVYFDFQEILDQISWFNQTMADAFDQNDRILLLAHVPFGIDEILLTRFYTLFTEQRLFAIIEKYSENIIMCFSGHRHQDTFRVYSISNTVLGILGHPSISPLDFFSEPSIRHYTYNRKSLILLDYDQYILNLIETEKSQIDQWILSYSFSSWYYQPKELTSKNLLKLAHLITKNFFYLKRFLLLQHYRENIILTNQNILQTLCSLTLFQFDEFLFCIQFLKSRQTNYPTMIMNYSLETNVIINEQFNQMKLFIGNCFLLCFILIIIFFLIKKIK